MIMNTNMHHIAEKETRKPEKKALNLPGGERSKALFGAGSAERRSFPGVKLTTDLCTTRVLNEFCSEVCCETAHGRVCNTYCNDPA